MEILAPAGSLEKLKMALLYGADAVYLSGQNFSLRSASSNFSIEEMLEARRFATSLGKKIYLTLNAYMHDEEIDLLPEFLSDLRQIAPDALIVSDLGAISVIKKQLPDVPIHLSTQASLLNSEGGKLWKSLGLTRLILGREASIEEAKAIKVKTGLEVEIFIHGSMCMAYSGQCLLSNYTAGRDANRGGCSHTCRFNFNLEHDGEQKEAFFYSSKDLMGLDLLAECYEAGIDSLKIEGRMKSFHYAATVSSVYAHALKLLKNEGVIGQEVREKLMLELDKISHRAYSDGHLAHRAGIDTVFDERENSDNNWNVVGIIRAVEGEEAILEVRHPFSPRCRLELFLPDASLHHFVVDTIINLKGESIQKANPGSLAKIKVPKAALVGAIVRVMP